MLKIFGLAKNGVLFATSSSSSSINVCIVSASTKVVPIYSYSARGIRTQPRLFIYQNYYM